jgi:hypothetical protein
VNWYASRTDWLTKPSRPIAAAAILSAYPATSLWSGMWGWPRPVMTSASLSNITSTPAGWRMTTAAHGRHSQRHHPPQDLLLGRHGRGHARHRLPGRRNRQERHLLPTQRPSLAFTRDRLGRQQRDELRAGAWRQRWQRVSEQPRPLLPVWRLAGDAHGRADRPGLYGAQTQQPGWHGR